MSDFAPIVLANSPRLSKEFQAERLAELPSMGGRKSIGVANSMSDIPIFYQGADGEPMLSVGLVSLGGETSSSPTPTETKPDKPRKRKAETSQPQQHVPAPVIVSQSSMTPKKFVKVKLSSPVMGRTTLALKQVEVSETLVVLCYDVDAPAIVEPPVHDNDNPLIVEYDGKVYKCIFAGWTVTIGDTFQVVLIKIDD
jgi:hypothetical protein